MHGKAINPACHMLHVCMCTLTCTMQDRPLAAEAHALGVVAQGWASTFMVHLPAWPPVQLQWALLVQASWSVMPAQSLLVGRQREMRPQPALLHSELPPGSPQHLSVAASQLDDTHLQSTNDE
jgi:hypothetical protein